MRFKKDMLFSEIRDLKKELVDTIKTIICMEGGIKRFAAKYNITEVTIRRFIRNQGIFDSTLYKFYVIARDAAEQGFVR